MESISKELQLRSLMALLSSPLISSGFIGLLAAMVSKYLAARQGAES